MNFEPVKIEEFFPYKEQFSTLGKNTWSVARLIELSRDFPVYEVPIMAMGIYKIYEVNMREFVMHMKTVLAADLDYPIILDEDGEIMDGRHRLMKAMLEGKETIKVVRFQKNPAPCSRNEG